MNFTFDGGLGFSHCDYILDTQTAESLTNHTRILGILSIVTSSLSIIGSGSVICYVVYHRICRSPDINSFFHLSIADLLLGLFWVVGPIIHFIFHKQVAPNLTVGKFCVLWQALCQMVHMMSFFLTINYAFNVFLRMKEKRDRVYENHMDDDLMVSQQRVARTHILKTAGFLFSWLIPIILIVPLILEVLKQESSCQLCIILLDAPRPTTENDQLLGYNGFVLMIVTLGFSIITIVALYVCTLRMSRQTLLGFHTNRERVVIYAMKRRTTAYIIVFVYCWTPALILSAMALSDAYSGKNAVNHAKSRAPFFNQYFPLFVVQTLTAPLQGFLNSLVYGWTRRTFREAVTRESRRWMDYSSYGTVDDSPSSSLMSSTEVRTQVNGRAVSRTVRQ